MLKRIRTVLLIAAAGYILGMGMAPRPNYLSLVKANPAYVRIHP